MGTLYLFSIIWIYWIGVITNLSLKEGNRQYWTKGYVLIVDEVIPKALSFMIMEDMLKPIMYLGLL